MTLCCAPCHPRYYRSLLRVLKQPPTVATAGPSGSCSGTGSSSAGAGSSSRSGSGVGTGGGRGLSDAQVEGVMVVMRAKDAQHAQQLGCPGQEPGEGLATVLKGILREDVEVVGEVLSRLLDDSFNINAEPLGPR